MGVEAASTGLASDVMEDDAASTGLAIAVMEGEAVAIGIWAGPEGDTFSPFEEAEGVAIEYWVGMERGSYLRNWISKGSQDDQEKIDRYSPPVSSATSIICTLVSNEILRASWAF